MQASSVKFTMTPILDDTYPIWDNSTFAPDINLALNIYDIDGTLSDTLVISNPPNGNRNYLILAFYSDTEGGPVLTALSNAESITETGDWQPVLSFDATGQDLQDHYTFQFRSDIDESQTPLPAAIWLFGTALAGAAGVGKWRRKKKIRAPIT